jgi:hypothetical protein
MSWGWLTSKQLGSGAPRIGGERRAWLSNLMCHIMAGSFDHAGSVMR